MGYGQWRDGGYRREMTAVSEWVQESSLLGRSRADVVMGLLRLRDEATDPRTVRDVDGLIEALVRQELPPRRSSFESAGRRGGGAPNALVGALATLAASAYGMMCMFLGFPVNELRTPSTGGVGCLAVVLGVLIGIGVVVVMMAGPPW